TAVQLDEMFFAKIEILFAVTAIRDRFLKQLAKCFPELRQIDPVLRPFWSGNARLYVCQINIEIHAVVDFAFARYPEHFLRAKIIFEGAALLVASSCGPEIIHRLLINRK